MTINIYNFLFSWIKLIIKIPTDSNNLCKLHSKVVEKFDWLQLLKLTFTECLEHGVQMQQPRDCWSRELSRLRDILFKISVNEIKHSRIWRRKWFDVSHYNICIKNKCTERLMRLMKLWRIYMKNKCTPNWSTSIYTNFIFSAFQKLDNLSLEAIVYCYCDKCGILNGFIFRISGNGQV